MARFQGQITDECAPGLKVRLSGIPSLNATTGYTEDFGHDLLTGASHERKHHAELNPAARAILHRPDK